MADVVQLTIRIRPQVTRALDHMMVEGCFPNRNLLIASLLTEIARDDLLAHQGGGSRGDAQWPA